MTRGELGCWLLGVASGILLGVLAAELWLVRP